MDYFHLYQCLTIKFATHIHFPHFTIIISISISLNLYLAFCSDGKMLAFFNHYSGYTVT